MATKQTGTGGSKGTTKKTSQSTAKSGNGDVKNGVVVNKAFEGMSVEDIQAQLDARREAEVANLKEKLAKLEEERSTVQERIAVLSGVARNARRGGSRGSRGPRAKNDRSLTEVLHEILKKKGEPMSARQLEEALKETDYTTNAKNKYVVIFTALTKHPDMFKKAERGLYEAI